MSTFAVKPFIPTSPSWGRINHSSVLLKHFAQHAGLGCIAPRHGWWFTRWSPQSVGRAFHSGIPIVAQALARSRSNRNAWWMNVCYHLREQSTDQCEISVKGALGQPDSWRNDVLSHVASSSETQTWGWKPGFAIQLDCQCWSLGRLLNLWASVSSSLKWTGHRQQVSNYGLQTLGESSKTLLRSPWGQNDFYKNVKTLLTFSMEFQWWCKSKGGETPGAFAQIEAPSRPSSACFLSRGSRANMPFSSKNVLDDGVELLILLISTFGYDVISFVWWNGKYV